MPAFQNRAGGGQYPHGEKNKSERELRQGFFGGHLAEEIEKLPREKLHQKDVGDENYNVEQQSAICPGKEFFKVPLRGLNRRLGHDAKNLSPRRKLSLKILAALVTFGVRRLVAALVCGGLTPDSLKTRKDVAATGRDRAKR